MIELRNVTKRYGVITALDDVSLTVGDGESCALLGPNGAGKTTIIRILLDFTKPTHGQAYIAGVPCSEPSSRSGVGYLPEVARLPGYLTGRQYLERQAELFDVPKSERKELIGNVLETTGISERQSTRLSTYSKGMMQRIGLAAALLCRPKLIILDEPTSGLDPLGIRELRTILESVRQQKTTILMNSHILSEVERVCDTAAIMDKGKILVKDRISELLHEGELLEDVFVRVVGRAGNQ